MKYTEHDYAASELEYKNFLSPSLKSAIASLGLEEDSFILDAGCGPGATLLPLLEATNSHGKIIGIDASGKHLEIASSLIEKYRVQKNVSLISSDLFDKFPFDENTFDLVWFSDVLFPDDTGDKTINILSEAKRVLRPGGTLAIFYGNWLRLHLLEGYSELEHIISISNEQSKSRQQKWTPALHPENGLKWLNELGMTDCAMSFHDTFYHAPLPSRIEIYIRWHLKNIYAKSLKIYVEKTLKRELLEILNTIIDPSSKDYLLTKPWYYCRASPILFTGRK
jgi:ubiquinone/menaquinone biosynthesis C-methylase UbiE